MYARMCTYGMSKSTYSLGPSIAILGHFGIIFHTCMFGLNVCLFNLLNKILFKILGSTRKMPYESSFAYS